MSQNFEYQIWSVWILPSQFELWYVKWHKLLIYMKIAEVTYCGPIIFKAILSIYSLAMQVFGECQEISHDYDVTMKIPWLGSCVYIHYFILDIMLQNGCGFMQSSDFTCFVFWGQIYILSLAIKWCGHSSFPPFWVLCCVILYRLSWDKFVFVLSLYGWLIEKVPSFILIDFSPKLFPLQFKNS